MTLGSPIRVSEFASRDDGVIARAALAGTLIGREPVRGRVAWSLAAILAVAFGVRAYVIFTQLYAFSADETFQYLEQAGRINTGSGMVPWEYVDGIRSWLLPGVLSGLMRVADLVSDDPLTRIRLLRLVAATLSLAPVYVGFRYGQRIGGTAGAILTGGLCAVWFELVYFAPVILTEVISAHISLIAIYLNDQAAREPDGTPAARRRLVFAGACFALAAYLRFQYVPGLLGAALWLNRLSWSRWRGLLTGGLPVALLTGGVLDTVTLGLPFQSIWLYAVRNVGQGVSASFGVLPWYFYAREMWWLWHAAVPLAVFAIAGVVRVPVLALTALLVAAPHSALGHKEYRFIYLALAIAPMLIGVGLTWFASWLAHVTGGGFRRGYAVSALLPLAAAVSWYAATHDVMARRWPFHDEVIEAFLAAHARPDLCGLGVIEGDVFHQGGYTYLARDVPIFVSSYRPVMYRPGSRVPFRTEVMLRGRPVSQYPGAAMVANTQRFNYLVASAVDGIANYAPVACFPSGGIAASEDRPTTCLYQRPGNCG
jgi:phosphatidylinositol glycan class B